MFVSRLESGERGWPVLGPFGEGAFQEWVDLNIVRMG